MPVELLIATVIVIVFWGIAKGSEWITEKIINCFKKRKDRKRSSRMDVGKINQLTNELNKIEGVEVTTTCKLIKERDALKAENEKLKKENKRYKNLMGWLEGVDFESIARAIELAKIAALESEE